MKRLGIYIHWPFCQSKCPYCDFNSHVREKVDETTWRQALLTELRSYKEMAQTHQVDSLFFGGGTPSLMSPQTVQALIEDVHALFSTNPNLEITLEANPTSIEAGKFKDFKKAGVNRVSVGIQSLNADDLRFLGRRHSVDEACRALKIASSTFDNFTFDLIYARPGQTVTKWEEELNQALSYGSPHLSLYQLTIEPNTAFATQYARGDFALPDEETSAALYEATATAVDQFGLRSYEISNYAKPGFESIHNTIYWEYDDYMGIGPGAHGRITREGGKVALQNHRAPETWLTHVTKMSNGLQENRPLSPSESMDECLLMGLRLAKGFPESRLKTLCHKGFQDVLDMSEIKWLHEQGFVEFDPERLIITPKGQICLNTILEKIVL